MPPQVNARNLEDDARSSVATPSVAVPPGEETIAHNESRVASAVERAIGGPGKSGHFVVEMKLDPLLTVGVFVRAPREFIGDDISELLEQAHDELACEIHEHLAKWLECRTSASDSDGPRNAV